MAATHQADVFTSCLLRENPYNPAKTGATKKIAAGTGTLAEDALILNTEVLPSPLWVVKLNVPGVGSKPFPVKMPEPYK